MEAAQELGQRAAGGDPGQQDSGKGLGVTHSGQQVAGGGVVSFESFESFV